MKLGLERIKQRFPANFDEWEKLDLPETASEAVTAANLARLTGTASILPSALYVCSILPTDDLLDGVATPHGKEQLASSDLRRCLNAEIRLARAKTAIVLEILRMDTIRFTRSRHCVKQPACRDSLTGDLEWIGHDTSFLVSVDALVSHAGWIKKHLSRLCESCMRRACDVQDGLRRRLWSELPEIFGLEVEGWK